MTSLLSPDRFRSQFARFQRLIAANDKGHAFTNFHEGLAGVWERYKPRLRDHALRWGKAVGREAAAEPDL